MLELLRRLALKPGIAAELVVASFLANLLALATPLFVIQVLNRYVAHGVDATLATLTTGAALAVLLEFGFRQVRLRLARVVGAAADEAVALAGFGAVTGAKAQALERIPPGQRREALAGAAAIESAYSAANLTAVLDVPFALLFVGVLYLLSPVLAAITAAFLGLVVVAGWAASASLRRPTRDLAQAGVRGAELMATATQAIDLVRAFSAAGPLRAAWRSTVRRAQDLKRRIVARQGFASSFTQAAAGMMSVVTVAVGATLVVAGKLDVGALIGANILAARALQPLSRYAQMGEAFAAARQAMAQLAELARLPRELETGSAKVGYRGHLELKDLAFAFAERPSPLFESVSLALPPGATLVVSGGNGTGKTTFARLLVGILEPSRGQILVDGLDLRQAVPDWWRRQVVYVPQEPTFMTATIEENLKTLRPDLSNEVLNQIVIAAGLRRFLDESPNGFATVLTDGGRHLSLGIRRRLALARALTTDGMLAIFDEPTEGLDTEGVQQVQAAIADLARRGRTVIVLSHDPNAVKGAGAVLDLNSKPVPRLVSLARPPANEPRQLEATE